MEVTLDKPKEFKQLQERLRKAQKAFRGKPMQKVLEQIANLARGLMASGIESGRPDWPPLSEVTQQMKGGARPLVDTSEMVDAIEAWKDGGEWYAGIPDSSPAATRAAVHENGAHIPVSDKMRVFFAAQGFPLRKDTRFVRIPARPWLKPAEKELDEFLADRLEDLMEPVLKAATEG